ncbi:LPXTG cell wall anchor domain-containing protein [Liquorilactobacillus satsumensis]|nr:LPXTG cell wall anchor domain-containing protein [Liquorilactobacillus satsumensis]MCP9329322.1 LPXTG cell wall anchor domain-containing protein [Liquorilactobacillus satsumensis]
MTEKSIPANVQVTDKKTPVQPEKPENPTQSSSSKPRTGTSGSTINKQTGSSDKRTSKGNLPQTGEQYSGYLTVIGIVIILAVLGIILYRRRLNHKNSK